MPVYVRVCVFLCVPQCVFVRHRKRHTSWQDILYKAQTGSSSDSDRGCQRKEQGSSRSKQRGRGKRVSRREGEGNREQADAGSHCKFQLPLHVTFAFTLLLLLPA